MTTIDQTARSAGHPLDGRYYTDHAIFEHDVESIFERHWLFACTVAELREPGDYVTVDVGRASVIVLNDDDELRAVRNVCRHRGSRLLEPGRGSVATLVCPYHQWTYATDGELLFAPTHAPDLDPACWALKPVAIRSIGGLVFVCLADSPPDDIDDVAAVVEPYLLPHGLARTAVAAQHDVVEAANWKLVMENNRECYHCEANHPELTRTFFPTYGLTDIPSHLQPAHDRYLAADDELRHVCRDAAAPLEPVEQLRGRATAFRIQREPLDAAGESYTMDGKIASRRLLGDITNPRFGRLTVHFQPNFWAHFLSDHAVVSTAIPIAADRTLVRTTWLVHADAIEGADYRLGDLTAVWVATNDQDRELVARAQLGVADPAYEPGPYAPSEYQVGDFVTWYLERSGGYA